MKRNKILPHVFFAILVGVFVLLNNSGENKINKSPVKKLGISENKIKETANVVRVVDGDTIEVSLSGQKETVRLIGIDAPENVDPRTTIECFGKEASDKAKEVLSNKTVSLEADLTQGNRDKYRRLLRYVFIDGENFNRIIISEGFAHEYTYQSNPYKYMDEFKDAERIAREEKRGLWKENICKIP